MIYILVGPDATGKTTYAKKLSENTGFPIIKMDKPKTQEEKDNMFNDYLKMFVDHDNFIMDRSFICEQVYGPLFRGKSYISDVQLALLDSILSWKGATIIHFTDDVDAIMERFNVTGEDFVTTREQVKHIVNEYFEVLKYIHHVPVVTINVFKQQAEAIEEEIQKRRR